MKIKDLDAKILFELKAGESPETIAQKLKLPKSTMYYHFGKVKKLGFIRGVKVTIDYEQLKDTKEAFILVSLSKTDVKSLQEFEDYIKNTKLLSDAYAVGGDWDYLLVVHGKEEDVTRFLMNYVQTLPNVVKTHSLFVLKHIEL
jgi:DNA-binding Lrp family transcriptional regulator